MWRLTFPLFFFVTLLTHYNSFSVEKIKVIINADAYYPPYSYIKNNKATGIYFKILQKVFENFDEKYSIEIRPLPWTLAVEEVKNGKAFAVYPPYNIPESRPWMDYSEEILKETIAVFCQSSLKKWPDDYKNSKIGMNYGFAYPPSIFKILRDYKMLIYVVDNSEVGLKLFHNKKIDCYLNDQDAVLFTNNTLHFPPIKESSILLEVKSYLGYSKDYLDKFKFKDDFNRKFNANLRKLKENGTIDLIINDFLKKH